MLNQEFFDPLVRDHRTSPPRATVDKGGDPEPPAAPDDPKQPTTGANSGQRPNRRTTMAPNTLQKRPVRGDHNPVWVALEPALPAVRSHALTIPGEPLRWASGSLRAFSVA